VWVPTTTELPVTT